MLASFAGGLPPFFNMISSLPPAIGKAKILTRRCYCEMLVL